MRPMVEWQEQAITTPPVDETISSTDASLARLTIDQIWSARVVPLGSGFVVRFFFAFVFIAWFPSLDCNENNTLGLRWKSNGIGD